MTTQTMTLEQVQARMVELKEQITFWQAERKTIFDSRYHTGQTHNLFGTMDNITDKVKELKVELEELNILEFELQFC